MNGSNSNSEGKLFSLKLDAKLVERIDKYLKSPNAVAKFKGQLFILAVNRFLDREEIIARELDEQRYRIEKLL